MKKVIKSIAPAKSMLSGGECGVNALSNDHPRDSACD